MDATNIKLIGCDIVSDAYPTCTHSYTSYQIHVLNVTLLYGSVVYHFHGLSARLFNNPLAFHLENESSDTYR